MKKRTFYQTKNMQWEVNLPNITFSLVSYIWHCCTCECKINLNFTGRLISLYSILYHDMPYYFFSFLTAKREYGNDIFQQTKYKALEASLLLYAYLFFPSIYSKLFNKNCNITSIIFPANSSTLISGKKYF